MTAKELTALAREVFGERAMASWWKCPVSGYEYLAYLQGGLGDRLTVYGDTKAEAQRRFVACLRAIQEVGNG